MSPPDKRSLRRQILQRRSQRSADDIAEAGVALAAHVAAEPSLARPQRVAVYLAMGTEPPTSRLIETWRSLGRDVIVPVVDGQALDWVELTSDSAVVRSPLGIDEPTGPRLGHAAVHDCDLVVVPALAVDHRGIRLGRGAGYYDRALASVTAPVTAVVFADELLPVVPSEPHDIAVTSVLTPAGLFRVLAD